MWVKCKPLHCVQALSLVAACALVATLSVHELCSNDVWMHLAAGRHIAATGRVPRVDPFSYGAGEGRPWLDHEWLAQLAFYSAYRVGGAGGLLALQTLLVLIGAGFGAAAVARRFGLGWAACAVALVGLMAYPRMLVRPEVFAFACAGAMLWLVSDSGRAQSRSRAKLVAWLAGVGGVMAVWANAHPSFPVGVGIVGAFALGAISEQPTEPDSRPWRRVGWLCAGVGAAALACMANPCGPALWLHPFRQLGASSFMQGVGEWKPLLSPDVGGAWRVAFGAAVAAGVVGFALNLGSLALGQALVFVGASLLPLPSARHVGLAAFLVAPIVIGQLALAARRWLWRTPVAGRVAACAALIVACVGLSALAARNAFYDPQKCARPFGLGLDQYLYPIQAADFAERVGLRGPMFNNYDVGGYLMWRLGPERKVFIDGRNMVYGEAFYKRYRESLASRKLWQQIARERGFEWVLVRHTSVGMDGLVRWLHDDTAWALCCFDKTGIVFVRRDGVNAAVAARCEIKLADAPDWKPPDVDAILASAERGDPRRDIALASLFRKLGLYRRAAQHQANAARLDPRNAKTLSDLGGLCLELGSQPQAERLLRAALALDPSYASARVNLANLCAATGRLDEAIEHNLLALEQRPNDLRLHRNLGYLYHRQGDQRNAIVHYRQLAALLLCKGRKREAAAVCKYLLKQDSNDPVAQRIMARIAAPSAGP